MAAGHEERVAFCVGAPAGRLREDDVRLLLGVLTRGPEGELDVRDDVTGARLVAAVIERAEHAANAAEMVPLGLSGPRECWEGLLARAVDEALALARTGPRSRLQVPLVSALSNLTEPLRARGFAVSHSEYFMATATDAVTVVPPPMGARFVDWSPAWPAEVVSDVMRRAFAGSPGVMFLPPEQLRARFEAAAPPVRLLVVGDQLAGVVRLKPPPPGSDSGYVQLIVRDPAFRGRGLGDVLLTEAMRGLRAIGARRYQLEVTAQNDAAVALYKRHAFEVVLEDTTWDVGLREPERPPSPT